MCRKERISNADLTVYITLRIEFVSFYALIKTAARKVENSCEPKDRETKRQTLLGDQAQHVTFSPRFLKGTSPAIAIHELSVEVRECKYITGGLLTYFSLLKMNNNSMYVKISTSK